MADFEEMRRALLNAMYKDDLTSSNPDGTVPYQSMLDLDVELRLLSRMTPPTTEPKQAL